MMAADYRHIGGRENRLGRHYSRFSPFWPTPALSGQSLALRKLCDAGSNRRSQVSVAFALARACRGLKQVFGRLFIVSDSAGECLHDLRRAAAIKPLGEDLGEKEARTHPSRSRPSTAQC